MAIETQGRMDFGVTMVRLWFLVYFGLMGFGPAGMFLFVLITEGMRGKSTRLDVVALILIYAFFHICAIVQVLRRASWAWTFTVMVVTFDLVLHGAITMHPARADLAQKIFLLMWPMLSLVLLAIPGVKPRLGSRVRAV